MSHQTIRVNLNSVVFPFTMDLWGRSIIVPQYDQNYERGAAYDKDIGKEKGVPQCCYLHNCMPTTEGYQSIGFTTAIQGDGVSTDFDRCFPILQTTPNNARFLFSPSNGKNRIYDQTVGSSWLSVSPFASGSVGDNSLVTTAYVQGQTYIYYSSFGCYVYDQVAKLLTSTALSGLTPTAVRGITSSFGYMIAFSTNQISWSNATLPTDFVPSISTGAGGGSVNDIKGNIITCIPVSGGFLVFCEKNVVSAKYTGNIRFPFIFKEIPGSGGVNSADQIAIGSNLADVYAYTTVGLQQFTLTTCENVFPDASDFLSKLIYEDFDDTTLTFTETNLSSPLKVRVAAVSDRFLVISYGVSSPEFTYAIIYDLTLKRWGKVKITHRAVFQWNAPNLFGAVTYGQLGSLTYGDLAGITYGDLLTSVNTPEVPLKTLAFLQADGTAKVINFDLSEATANGTLLLGKFQFMRNKFICHQYSDLENIPLTSNFAMYVIATLDGKTLLTPQLAALIKQGTLMRRYAVRVTGQNYSLLLKGAFNFTSVLTDFTLAGDR